MKIKLIVGLGNPGPQYNRTRHNAGSWFVETLVKRADKQLHAEKKFHGLHTTIPYNDHSCHLLIPTTFMNHSGQAIQAIASYYKINPSEMLIAHDDLDLPVGTIKLKSAGGHGGHNGLRNIIEHLKDNHFHRLRIGIGHPGHRDRVLDYVLGNPSIQDTDTIQAAIDEAISVIPTAVNGDIQKAMQLLHTSP